MKQIGSYVGLAVLVLVGCGGLDKGGEKRPGPAVPAPTPLSSTGGETLKATLLEGATPQAYTVTLNWNSESDRVALYRESPSRARQLVGTFDRTVKTFAESDLPAGETVTYTLTEESDLGRTTKVQLTVPRDLEVTGRLSTKRITGIQRLFLKKGAEVVGIDGQLEIHVDQVISEEALLRSFPPESAASQGNPGASGEFIVVRARRGAGTLFVMAHGQTGGQGLTGPDGERGSEGKPGLAATLVSNLFISSPMRPEPPVLPLTDPELTRFTAGKPPGDMSWAFYKCHTAPTDGGTGGAGAKGGKGSPGARGGNAGNLFVSVTNPGGLHVVPQSYGGFGGVAGRGGPGGKGGPGGQPGTRDGGELCPSAKVGPLGPNGPEGDAGEAGPAGDKGIVCLKLGNARFGDCDQLPGAAPYLD